jgi:hypothetical protein
MGAPAAAAAVAPPVASARAFRPRADSSEAILSDATLQSLKELESDPRLRYRQALTLEREGAAKRRDDEYKNAAMIPMKAYRPRGPRIQFSTATVDRGRPDCFIQ